MNAALILTALGLIAWGFIRPRDPWARTRQLRADERLALYTARRGPLGDDLELTRRFCSGLHVAAVFAMGGRIIRSWSHLLPPPSTTEDPSWTTLHPSSNRTASTSSTTK